MNNLTAVLLTGGDSGRLWPLKDKSSLSFLGTTLIEHKINLLSRAGIKNFIIVVNKENALSCHNMAEKYKNIKLDVIIQKIELGMAGALLSAAELIMDKPVLILTPSDVFKEEVITSFLDSLDTDTEVKVLGLRSDNDFIGGYMTYEGKLVTHIIEKPPLGRRPGNLVKMVFDYFKSADKLLDKITQLRASSDDIYERAMQTLIDNGAKVQLWIFSGDWAYLKYPWHTLNVMDFFLKELTSSDIKSAKIDKSVIIKGNVWIEEGVEIAENSVIAGPVYIGKRTKIGNNVLIRNSMIGHDCVVGFGTEIARSYIGGGCFFHKNYIGDSVLADNVYFGAGAITANFRLDGKEIKSAADKIKIDTSMVKLGAMIGGNCKIGVNVSLAPGIKVGAHTFINSGNHIDRDIEDNKFVPAPKNALRIINNKEV